MTAGKELLLLLDPLTPFESELRLKYGQESLTAPNDTIGECVKLHWE